MPKRQSRRRRARAGAFGAQSWRLLRWRGARPNFCDDFDHDQPVVYHWDNHNRTPDIGASGGGAIEPELVRFESGPRAAALSIPALTDATFTATAILQATLKDPAPRDSTIAMEPLIETEDFPPSSGVVGFRLLSSEGGRPSR